MKREIKRVLLMIDDGNGAEGSVYDLSALVAEMLPKASYSSRISVSVEAEKTYERDPAKPQSKIGISFGGDAGGEWVHGASHLEDVINSAMPDGERVIDLKKKVTKLRNKADQFARDAMHAKLDQVSAIRAQHPIATFSATPALNAAP